MVFGILTPKLGNQTKGYGISLQVVYVLCDVSVEDPLIFSTAAARMLEPLRAHCLGTWEARGCPAESSLES